MNLEDGGAPNRPGGLCSSEWAWRLRSSKLVWRMGELRIGMEDLESSELAWRIWRAPNAQEDVEVRMCLEDGGAPNGPAEWGGPNGLEGLGELRMGLQDGEVRMSLEDEELRMGLKNWELRIDLEDGGAPNEFGEWGIS